MQYVQGIASDTTIDMNGRQEVWQGGSAVNTEVGVWANADVHSGGSLIDATLDFHGVLSADRSAMLADITVQSGGVLDIWNDTLVRDRIVLQKGGVINISGFGNSSAPVYTFGGDNRVTITCDGMSETLLFDGIDAQTQLDIGIDPDYPDHIIIDCLDKPASGGTISSGNVTQSVDSGNGRIVTTVGSGGVVTSAVLGTSTDADAREDLVVESGGASFFTSVTPANSASVVARNAIVQEDVYGLSTSAVFSTTIAEIQNNVHGWGGGAEVYSASQYIHAGGESYGATFAGAPGGSFLPNQNDPYWGYTPITYFAADATQYVESGGLAKNTTLNAYSEQILSGGGVALHTTVNSGGVQTVQSNGSAFDTTINSGGEQTVASGGSAADTTINAYGSSFVTSGGTAIDVDVGSGGVLSAGSGATLTDITLENGGRLDVSKDTLFTDRLVFNGGTIDITDLTGTGTPDYTFSGDNRLTITQGGVSETILFDGVYDPTKLLVTTDTDGSTLIDYGTPAPCYCPGTLIATAQGETPVEALAIGDLVRTASGALRPIRWIGRRAYDGVFARGNPDLIPVTFERGSLGNNTPKRALTVSPLHAMFVEGYLIPAHCLVNGGSIHFDSIGERVEYIHIELESHDLLLAEGAASESFVDDGSRGMFHNAGTFAELYPDAETVEAVYCAPRLEDGTVLEHIRDRLSAHTGSTVRLGLLASDRERQLTGWAVDLLTPSEPVALEVLLDGRVIGMTLADGPSDVVSNGAAAYGFTFGLPRGVTTASGAFSLRALSSVKAAA
ncbi:MAG: Hint domain-containing protein [Acetobacter sp.]|uniref:Hint domain-containing protein n=1 Tax=Acetobacter sp. TaxID=440 RepID=UPI0039E917E7